MVAPKNIFLTGRPGSGKTTAILRTLELLPPGACGFTTREVREGGHRVGFLIQSLNGQSALMASVRFKGPLRVGRYGVDTAAVEKVGVAALRRALSEGRPAVVDEVGKMELACPAFRDALSELLDAEIPVLGTVHMRREPVAESLRSRRDTLILHLTPANRDEIPGRLAGLLMPLWRSRG